MQPAVPPRHRLKRGACLSIPRGRDRGRFRFSRGGADVVGSRPNEEATTTDEAKSARSRRVGWERGVCGVARLGRRSSLRPAPRALHPLPLPANAAHAEYSDRLLGIFRRARHRSATRCRSSSWACSSGTRRRPSLAIAAGSVHVREQRHDLAKRRPRRRGAVAEIARRVLRLANIQPEGRRQQVVRQQIEGRVHGLPRAVDFDAGLRLQILDGADDRLAEGRDRVGQTLDLLLQIDRRESAAACKKDREAVPGGRAAPAPDWPT